MKLFAAPTSDEWIFLGIVAFLVAMMITGAELVRRLLNGSTEITRKSVHVVVGIMMACAPAVFHSGIPALLISVAAILLTFFAIRIGILDSLHDTSRTSYGTTFHPTGFFILVLLLWDSHPAILSISILILAIPDALAAVVGKHVSHPHYFFFTTDNKTAEGSFAMFLSSFVLFSIFLWWYNDAFFYPWYVIASVTALFVTAWELICSKGLDNLTVPLSAAFMQHVFLVQHQIADQLLTAVALGIAIGIVSYYFHFLNASGSIATYILATIIYGIGGWDWTVPILTFFITSSMLSKIGAAKKKKTEYFNEKSDKRDAGQVAANGGVAGFIILLWYMFPDQTSLYYFFIAAVAAVAADTWGTEIGTLAKKKPRSIITFKTVETGTSGGISIPGLIGALVGSAIVVLSSVWLNPSAFTTELMLLLILSGFAGSIVDSILGATVQAQFRSIDGRITEKSHPDGMPGTLIRGYAWMNNDAVNWLCAFAGALMMFVLH